MSLDKPTKNVHNLIMNTDWKKLADHLNGFFIERAYHYSCREPLFSTLHTHDLKFHIVYIFQGKSTITIDSNRYDVGPKTAIFIRPGQFHQSLKDQGTYYELIEVHFMAESARFIPFVPALAPVTRVHNIAAFVPALERLVAAHLIDPSPDNWLVKLRLAETLMLLDRETAGATPDDQVAGDTVRRIDQAREFIAVHYAKNLSLELLAEQVGMSSSHFSACFRKVTGISPIEFVIRRRMHHARELLANSNYSIAQIAAMCGFTSSQYMARMFLRREGRSPRRFRPHTNTHR